MADTLTVLPGAIGVPSVVAMERRSIDSSEWYVPEVPSAHELLIVFGWLGSLPPEMVSRPFSSAAPESHDEPTVAHCGAFNVLL